MTRVREEKVTTRVRRNQRFSRRSRVLVEDMNQVMQVMTGQEKIKRINMKDEASENENEAGKVSLRITNLLWDEKDGHCC